MAFRSNIAGSLGVGVQMLRANPLRTILSALGVIMGVASLVAVLAIGDGVEAFARKQIESTTDLQAIMVTPTTFDVMDDLRVPRNDFPVFALPDAEGLRSALGGKAVVALLVQGSSRVSPDTGRARGVTVTATTPAAVQLLRKPLAAGRFFTDAEVAGATKVAVVSTGLVRVIFPGESPAGAVGRSIRMEGSDLQIIGVAESDARQSPLSAFVPATLAPVVHAPSLAPRAPSLYVRSLAVENVPAVKQTIERWLTSRYGDWKARASLSGGEGMRLEQARQMVLIFKILMGAFAGISLVVGGIGIMNVLLAAVTERTREIGIRKATGARNRDILVQFLAESVAITSVGSVIGAAFGLGAAFAATAIMRAQTRAEVYAAFTWETVAVAALVCIITGLGFGTYPALRAARLSPVDAMRHE